jgi:hypothetical protein
MLAPEALEAAEPEAWCLPQPYTQVGVRGRGDEAGEEEAAQEGGESSLAAIVV